MRSPSWPVTQTDALVHASALFLPAAGSAALLPALEFAYQASTAASGSTDFPLLIAFLLSKRVCLYATAAAAVAVSALRSLGSEPRTGARLKLLTAEIFGSDAAASLEAPEGRDTVRALDSLDETPALAQAAALPVILSLLLLGSFVLLPSPDPGAVTGGDTFMFAGDADLLRSLLAGGAGALRAVASGLAPLSNAGLCLVFCRAEATALLAAAMPPRMGVEALLGAVETPQPTADAANPRSEKATADMVRTAQTELTTAAAVEAARPEIATAATALAALATASAFLLPPAMAWPVQNVLNICIAVSVSRLLALGRLLPIMLALAALAAYDVTFAGGTASAASMTHTLDSATATALATPVLGPSLFPAAMTSPSLSLDCPSNALATDLSLLVPTTTLAADPPSSVMESVARSRLSGAWQPGLIQIRVGGRLTDGLGLGDLVFPSLLAGWAARFDQGQQAGGARQREAGHAGWQGARGSRQQQAGREPQTGDARGEKARDARGQGTGEAWRLQEGDARHPEAGASGRKEAGSALLPFVLGGYLAGCLLLEVAPPSLSPAALSCLVPTTLTAVLLRLAATGAIQEAFDWDGAADQAASTREK
jgi:hypothetical protein